MFSLTTNTFQEKCNNDLCDGAKFLKHLVFQEKEIKNTEPIKQTVYRHDGVSVDKIIESDPITRQILKITNFDYFDDKKVKSIEEFEDGIKIRLTLYSFFKSVTDFEKTTGKKLKTTNYTIKDDSKIMSVYDYDQETERIIRMSVYRTDGKNIAFIKELSPQTGAVTRCINYKKNSSAISSVSKYELLGDTTVKTTYYYNTPMFLSTPEMINKKVMADTLNKKVIDTFSSKKVNRLIDNLYKNKKSFSSLKIS